MRQVVLYPGEDGYWVVECPSLPGCITQGKTKEEALDNAREAIRGYVAALSEDGPADRSDGSSYPPPSASRTLRARESKENGFSRKWTPGSSTPRREMVSEV